MRYKKYSTVRFFREVNTEAKARELIWQGRFKDTGFECPQCQSHDYYELKSRAHVRECQACHHQLSVKSGTIFQQTHIPLLTWIRAIFLMTKSKRGISALEMQRQLEMSRYATVLSMMNRIREALRQKDQGYKIEGIIELDGAHFGKKGTDTHQKVLVGVETKRWWDDTGKIKQRAGFAKVFIGGESHENIEELIKTSVKEGSDLKTDGFKSYQEAPSGVVTHQKVIGGDEKTMKYWLPWVHKFISNAKRWILGTHHGLNSNKYLELYLAEYTYRFNRRHDLNGLFHRAVTACAVAKPLQPAKSG